jgi:glutamyl-tRNA reductase
MTQSMINKIAHGPISELRHLATEPEGDHAIDVIRKVFHLQR